MSRRRDSGCVGAGVRLTDPLEQGLLDKSKIQQLSVDDLRTLSPGVTRQLDRLSRITEIAFATIPARDDGGLSIAALNRMILGAVRGLQSRR